MGYKKKNQDCNHFYGHKGDGTFRGERCMCRRPSTFATKVNATTFKLRNTQQICIASNE